MKNDLVAVLDLGSTKAAVLVASQQKGELQIEAAAAAECKGLKKGVLTDLEEATRAIDIAVRKVQQQLGQDINSLVLGIAGAHVECTNAQGYIPIFPKSRTITREDVLQVINHSRQVMLPPDREQIQALPREFKIDGQRGVQRPIGMSGSRLEVTTFLVTGQTSHIQNLEKAVTMAGKKVSQMVLQPLASGLAVLTEDEINVGAVAVDIGGGTTDLAIFSNGGIAFSVSLPVGGTLVTSDLSKLLKTTPEEAERLKLQHGAALASTLVGEDTVEVLQLGQEQRRPMQRKVMAEIIQSRMKEVAIMVRQQIEKSGMLGMLPGGIVLTGGGSLLEGIEELFAQEIPQLRVRVGEKQLSGQEDLRGRSMATCIGLAKFTLMAGEDDLLPAGGVDNWREKVRTLWSMFVK